MFTKGLPLKQIIFLTIGVLLLTANLYLPSKKANRNVHQQNIKYILQWGYPHLPPFDFMGKGFDAFLNNSCEFTNCLVTSDSNFFADVREFDVIVFNGKELDKRFKKGKMPAKRSAKQKYVYANLESSHYYPVCSNYFNNFFNWTWTYKLNSDSRWGYITIYNVSGGVEGPRENMQWPNLDPIDNETKVLLKSKSKAAAWFVSNCHSLSNRENFVMLVEKELKKFGLSLDVYGSCGKFVCPRSNSEECLQILAKDYYFYFAFENSLAEDYVTEKLVTSLNNYAVPVVFGEANYSRFLPPGSYLHAGELGPQRLAERMAHIITNHKEGDADLYHDFFRWRNHYTYELTAATEDVCKLCKMINDPELMAKETVYRNFTSWWNSKHAKCKSRRSLLWFPYSLPEINLF